MKPTAFFIACVTVLASAAYLATGTAMARNETMAEKELQSPEAFDSITDKSERSVALFNEMGKVLTHPRCANCHPRGDSPRQGMEMQVHEPPVVRGAGGLGAPGMRCTTCHGPGNVAFSTGEGSVPGHPAWRLAPAEQAWVGKSLAAICEQLKDEDRSHMTLVELQEHNANDTLVGWGWTPGEGREPVPGSQKIFGALTQAWIDSGAECPEG